MAKGFKHGAGGVGLNFKVICNPQLSTAKENTIWVDTDKINNYYFSAEQPENMVDYDVWFPIGTSSTVAFNALKKNGIQVYPLSVKQYIEGAWVDKTAKSWQNGEWVDWIFDITILSSTVDETGGWKWYPSGSNVSATRLSDGSYEFIRNSGGGGSGFLSMSKNTFDLTGYKTLQFDVIYVKGVDVGVGIMTPTNTSAAHAIAKKTVTTTGTGFTCDISTYDGEYAIAANLDAVGKTLVVANIKLLR